MRIFGLTRVKPSYYGSMHTDSLSMSLIFSDKVSYFTFKFLRLIGAFKFLTFFQSQFTRGDLSFLLRDMTLKIYLLICSKMSVAIWLRNFMWLFVGCTDFAHAYSSLGAQLNAALRMLYGFCALSGLCVRIRISVGCTAFVR